MVLPRPVERIFAGPAGRVEFAVDSVDAMAEGWDWYHKHLPEEAQNRFAALFGLWCKEGEIRNEEHFKRLDGSVYEFKTHTGFRFLCFRQNQNLILTNGLKKSGRKKITGDIQRCNTIAQRHYSWEQSQPGTHSGRLPSLGNH